MKLIFIRHGQAMAFTDDYDRLSELGWEQARLLGEHMVTEIPTIDHVFVGPRKRQRQTFEQVSAVFQANNRALPDATHLESLDELHSYMTFRAVMPALADQDAATAKLWNDGNPTRADHDKLLFSYMPRWVRGEIAANGHQTFAEFREVVAENLATVRSATQKGETAVCFTSAGTIATTVGNILSLDGDQTMDLMWEGLNSAMTTIREVNGRLRLAKYNETPHLTKAMQTVL